MKNNILKKLSIPLFVIVLCFITSTTTAILTITPENEQVAPLSDRDKEDADDLIRDH